MACIEEGYNILLDPIDVQMHWPQPDALTTASTHS